MVQIDNNDRMEIRVKMEEALKLTIKLLSSMVILEIELMKCNDVEREKRFPMYLFQDTVFLRNGSSLRIWEVHRDKKRFFFFE